MHRPLYASHELRRESRQDRKEVPMTDMRAVFSGFAGSTLALILTACGGDDSAAKDQTNQRTDIAAAGTPDRKSAASEQDKEINRGDCDLLTEAELDAAFGGKLSFGKFEGFRQRGSGCTVPTVGIEGQFFLQAQTKDSFEAHRDTYQTYADQSSATMAPVNVGVEGYIVNDAQIIAIDDQGRAISVALQLFVFGGDLPITKQESAHGVEAIARQALERF